MFCYINMAGLNLQSDDGNSKYAPITYIGWI